MIFSEVRMKDGGGPKGLSGRGEVAHAASELPVGRPAIRFRPCGLNLCRVGRHLVNYEDFPLSVGHLHRFT